jgi:hypothetical protein
VIIQGWTGQETVEEADRILPLHTFVVKDKAASPKPPGFRSGLPWAQMDCGNGGSATCHTVLSCR